MSDLVERLTNSASIVLFCEGTGGVTKLCREAADRIAHLETELRRATDWIKGAGHRPYCPYMDYLDERERPCTCGKDEILGITLQSEVKQP